MSSDRAQRNNRPTGAGASSVASDSLTPARPVPIQLSRAAALDPIITFDAAGVIQSASDSTQRVFGWAPTELVGRNIRLLVPGSEQWTPNGSLNESLDAERPRHPRRLDALRKDGSFLPIEVSVSRVDVLGKSAPIFVGLIHDLSEPAQGTGRKSARQARGSLPAGSEDSTRMHELLAEQTSALETAHMRLRMADRMASIGALAAGLGHDMNNVLLPVRAHLEAVRELTMLPKVRAHVDAVQKSVTYLQQLADGLHFLALDTEGDDSEKAATYLSEWWAQTGPLLTKAVPRQVSIRTSLPTDLPRVAASAHGLTQAVLNLVVNAGEAIPADRKGRIRIHAKAGPNDTHVRLVVKDNGQGMSEEDQRRAFEMFYTTKSRGLGTGLGLPLVARVVARAGGSVQIESELGKGTTVSILLPLADCSKRQSEARSAAVMLRDGRAASLIEQVLLVSDVRMLGGGDSADADLLIVEPTKSGLAVAEVWRKQHPRGGLVLWGRSKPASADAWSSLRPLIIEDPNDLDNIREALSRAIACS